MNSAVGELAIEIDGKEHTLRPSWLALISAEEAIGGKSLIQVNADIANGKPRLRDCATVLYHCWLAGFPPKESQVLSFGDFLAKLQASCTGLQVFTMAAALIGTMIKGADGRVEKKTDQPTTTTPETKTTSRGSTGKGTSARASAISG